MKMQFLMFAACFTMMDISALLLKFLAPLFPLHGLLPAKFNFVLHLNRVKIPIVY